MAKPRKRIWVQHVAVGADVLEARLDAARVGDLTPGEEKLAAGVADLILSARTAALREDPIPGRWWNWWRGTLVERAYRNLHAARALMVSLYQEDDLRAEVPSAVSRAQATIHREDPRSIAAADLDVLPSKRLAARLRHLIEDGYDAMDLEHAQLRSFRNIVLMSALLISVLMGATLWTVSMHPRALPLCFPNEILTSAGSTVVKGLNCPTRTKTPIPTGGDILIVALLGLLGGALTAILSIRKLKGTSTPYDVPVALAMLKVPLGAFTAVLGLVAIRGNVVPGFSVLDSQEQILAYALIFGFSQQAFTQALDKRAETLLSGLPGQAAAGVPQPPGQPATTAQPLTQTPPSSGIARRGFGRWGRRASGRIGA
jgi:hypothetical protein